MEKLADVLKIFIEKHLLPSVISIAGSITTLLFIPDDNWMLLKLGNVLFGILAFCIYFLCIQLWLTIVHMIKSALENANEKKYQTNRKKRESQEAIMRIHEFVDSLTPEDRELLITFVRNGNKILIDFNRTYCFQSLLNNSNIMNASEYRGEIWSVDCQYYWMTSAVKDVLEQGKRPISGFKQYKIKDDIFHDLDLVYRTEGKLGNF